MKTVTSNDRTLMKSRESINNKRDLEELRVSKQELLSGNRTGSVFVRFSPGSASFLVSRSVAEARIDRLLLDAIVDIEESFSNK